MPELDVPVSDDTSEPDTSECVPNCESLQCGEDGCGGDCGFCSGTETCVSGICEGESGGGIDCLTIITCINESDLTQEAFDACIARGTPSAQVQIGNVIACLQANCGEPGMSDEDFAACQENFCLDELTACSEG